MCAIVLGAFFEAMSIGLVIPFIAVEPLRPLLSNLNISDPRDLFFILGPAPIALFAIKTGSLIQLYRWPFRYALYRDVLVIDEGTANLGPRTEAAIFERIGGLRGKKTIIAITHRPALVRNCDCI